MIRWSTVRAAILLLAVLWPASASAADQADPIEGLDLPESLMAFSSGFLAHDMPVEGAVLEDAADTRLIIGSGTLLYVRMDNIGNVATGDLYTVYRRDHKVFHPVHGRYTGWLVTVRGIVQVTSIHPDLGIATVKVVRSFNAITPGDAVTRYMPPAQVEAPSPGRTLPEFAGMVVELPARQNLVGQYHVVYVDWGKRDGLVRGDHLDVFRPKPGRPPRWVGELRVLSVQDQSATALIVRSPVNILRGDRLTLKEPPKLPAQVEEELKPLESEIKGVEVRRDGEKLVISLVDQVLFDSGRAEIKPAGLEVLHRVGEVLRNTADQKILIEGHTDDVRIGRKLKKTYPTNWELAKARAASVLKYLRDEGGLDPERMAAAEYADTRPVAPNTTEEGRQKNRRVEIILMPSDHAASTPEAEPMPPIQPRGAPEPPPVAQEHPAMPPPLLEEPPRPIE
jgi:chemotaxis protein MotB